MAKYVLKRVLLMLFTFFVITTICFMLIRALPRELPLDKNQREVMLARFEALGYNEPLLTQYGIYLKNIFTAWDFGTSWNISFRTPAWDVLTGRLLPTVLVNLYSLLFSVPLGIALGIFAAIWLVEYARRGSRLVRIVRMAAETLSGIPSIVYGLFGYLCFVVTLHFGYSLLAGACTLTIMVLPLIMRTTEEALISVPDSFREGSFGLGAGRLRTVMKIVLPAAVPGILSGVILAIGRIVGETAALIYTSGTYTEICTDLMQSGRTLSVHMYSLSREGLYIDQAYATAVVLLILVVGINALSSLVAHKISSRAQGK